jgi:hypothetical protein
MVIKIWHNRHTTLSENEIKLRSGATSLFDVRRWAFDVRRSRFKTTLYGIKVKGLNRFYPISPDCRIYIIVEGCLRYYFPLRMWARYNHIEDFLDCRKQRTDLYF